MLTISALKSFQFWLACLMTLCTAGWAAQQSEKTPDSVSATFQAQAADLVKKLSGVGITGFMEPEFQVAQSKGETIFDGGNFPTQRNSRFIIRSGRFCTRYTCLDKNALPSVEICFEIDATQKRINLNEFWGRYNENK